MNVGPQDYQSPSLTAENEENFTKITVLLQTWYIQQAYSGTSTIATTWPFWGGIIFSTSRLQESPLCVCHKEHLCYETLHGSMLSYGKLSKLPISPYYPDRRQKVLACVFPVH